LIVQFIASSGLEGWGWPARIPTELESKSKLKLHPQKTSILKIPELLLPFIVHNPFILLFPPKSSTMGSNDVPPPSVPSYYLVGANTLLQVGGALWTLCYILMTRESFRSRTYGMPLLALANNFAWEIVYAFGVAEAPLERIVFAIWCVLDIGLLLGIARHGAGEWAHAPIIAKNLGKVVIGLIIWLVVGHWAFAKWWIDNEIGKREGKYYYGVVAADTSELGFWTAGVAQLCLSVASLAQLVVRQHTGGVSWSIW
jgi:hypothetical protein